MTRPIARALWLRAQGQFSIRASATWRATGPPPSSARCWRSQAVCSREISLTKLLFAWVVSILLPAVLFGLAPLVLGAWVGEASGRFAEATGVGAAIVVLAVLAVGWIGWRPLFRLGETNFWTLNALAVQPGYAFWREALRHLTERSLRGRTGAALARLRAMSCAGAGLLLFVIAARSRSPPGP